MYGLRLKKGTAWHPAYEAFCEEGEPCVITMENLKGITEVQPLGKNVFIVENEMVFSYLIDNLPDKNCTLLCTSGQLRFVSQKLLSLILENGTDVYYSGDIDPDGMGIADRLWMKFEDRIHMWRMSPEDYEKKYFKGTHWGKWPGEAFSHSSSITGKNSRICKTETIIRLPGKYIKRITVRYKESR